jgi:succinate-semialdehyde dehydrogenase/glutarate-semialdehyde dehydrogenase
VIEDPRIVAITLTGSVGAGSSVAAIAGKQIKKTVLELGGSDPFIVMPSVNLEATVASAVQARIINNGQSCIAAKRFIVHDAIYSEFERHFTQRMAALKVGDPLDDSTDVGPLATSDLVTTLENQVDRTVRMGARLSLGGARLRRAGNFYAPTVLADIPEESPARIEELFGPVASLFRVRGIEEAVALANQSQFGLGSSCWTNDQHERRYFINHIEAGMAFVNGTVVSDPRVPFGGVKQSGYGRELSTDGIREFVNIKTIMIYEVGPSATKTE